MKKRFLYFLLVILFAGCGHSITREVHLMSLGDLEGKTPPEKGEGKLVTGAACGFTAYLSDAVRDALKETDYDTILNAKVTSETGLFTMSNCFRVLGTASDSKTWPKQRGM